MGINVYNIYIYTHIYIYICIYIHNVCVCVCVCVWLYTYSTCTHSAPCRMMGSILASFEISVTAAVTSSPLLRVLIPMLRRRICPACRHSCRQTMSYEEEDNCMSLRRRRRIHACRLSCRKKKSHEEEDTCMSFEEEAEEDSCL